jgi:hypothetical protein
MTSASANEAKTAQNRLPVNPPAPLLQVERLSYDRISADYTFQSASTPRDTAGQRVALLSIDGLDPIGRIDG